MDTWLEEYVEQEIALAKADGKPNLMKILDEGFIDAGRKACKYDVYEKDDERIFYNGRKDKVILRFNVYKLMKGTV